jgi:phospholipase A1
MIKPMLLLVYLSILIMAEGLSITQLENAAKKGDFTAQYQLGKLYEEGVNVDRNMTKAAYWYKQASITSIPKIDNKTEIHETDAYIYHIDPDIDGDMKQFFFRHLDMPKGMDERKTLTSKILSNFGMLPYEKTYLIPIAYTTVNYEKRDPIEFPGYEEYNKNIETEFQISLKKDLSYNFFGFNEIISFGYTQEVWWQFYAQSSPFRETNYRPEAWLTLPVQNETALSYGIKAVKLGLLHESNGLGKPLSREWNMYYADVIFQYENFLSTVRAYYADAGSDNADITSYLGYGHVQVSYLSGKQQFDLTWQNNLDMSDNKGSIEVEWSYPIGSSENTFWYIKLFNGYGSSLMDYNQHQNRTGFGFLFSR